MGTTIDMQAQHADKVIFWFDGFDGEQPNEYLSNFYEGEPITEPGYDFAWKTGEHMFQAYKARGRRDFEAVHDATTPSQAKSIGRRIALRGDWESVKYDVMRWVLACKFGLDRDEGRRLLESGTRLLAEGTWWRDQVWGIDLNSVPPHGLPWHGAGRNWLGSLLMARRAELAAEHALGAVFDYSTIADFARHGRT